MFFQHFSRRQAMWSKFLSRLNFKISYRPGAQYKVDFLTRRSQNLTADSNPHQDYMEQVVLKPKNLSTLQPVQILCYQDIMLIEVLDQDLKIISQAYLNINLQDPVAIIMQIITNEDCHSYQ